MFGFYSFCEDSFAGLGVTQVIVVINFETGQIISWAVGPLISSGAEGLGEIQSIINNLGSLDSYALPLGDIETFVDGEGELDSYTAF